LASIWRRDWGLTALLVFLVLLMLVALPLIASGVLTPLFADVAFGLVLLSGVAALAGRRAAMLLTAGFALLALVMRGLRLGTSDPTLRLLDSAVSLLAVAVLAGLVLFQVFRKGPITLHRVQGAVAAYLLVGLAWGLAYEIALLKDPKALQMPAVTPPGAAQSPQLIYFSFVTLTTVGYGDIVPVHPAVRSLAMTEALIGQLFPAILIARLVSLEIAAKSSRDEREKDGR
jgi:hypothetical protein